MDKKSKWGYKKGSEFRKEPFIDIKSNLIDMSETPEDLLLIPDKGKPQIGKAFSGQILFPQAKKVREIPMKRFQHGGNFGLAGENTMPMSPFINLKPFINKYKLSHGGVIDYMATLPLEQQYQFAEEFDTLDKDTQAEVEEYLKGGYYQSGGINQYQRGGVPNAELEHDETLITPDGELSKIKGKKHNEGGEKVSLPSGTRIYSEHLKVPQDIVKQVLGKESKKKLSYADISKRFPTKPYIDILENPNSDEYQINTAEIKLASNLAKLDTLFFAQEKGKQDKEGNKTKFQRGGTRPEIRIPSEELENTFYTEYDLSDISDRFQLIKPGKTYEVVFDPVSKTTMTRNKITGTYDGKDDIIKNLPYVEPTVERTNPSPLLVRSQDWTNQFPKIHTEPSPTVTTGVVLNLRNDVPITTYDLPPVDIIGKKDQPSSVAPKVGSKQPKQSTKRRGTTSSPTPVIIEDSELQVPIPLERLPQKVYSNLSSMNATDRGLPSVPSVPSTEQVADSILSEDDKNFPGRKKKGFKFGISPELAGTVTDIGLALSDKLRVSEPTYYDRRKYPLFTRFVDFDDKEVQRMYDKNIQQIQNSNLPENVKQAKISELMGQYQDYQAKVDYGNLQRYEGKRERDTEKLQQYLDTNIDQRVADIESYRQRKARVDELKDAFYAQRKSRIVNSLKAYAEYADQISKANEFTPNYKINPITGRIDYKPQQQSNLRENILQQYQKTNQNKIDLGGGATAQVFGNVLIITDKDGKVSTQKLDQPDQS